MKELLKGRMPVAFAGVLGLLAAVIAWSAIRRHETEVRRGWNLVPVMVAAADIQESTVITNEMIAQRSIPEQFVTSSVVRPESAHMILNQKVLVPLEAGDPLLWTQFETTRSGERLASKVQKRFRAVTLEAGKGSTSVGGWIRPNDHIDVISTFRDPHTNEQSAITLLQNITVLATGKLTGTSNLSGIPENQREYSNISVLVLPEEAQLLMLASELGTLSFSLRNEDEVESIEDRTKATINTLISGERSKVLQQKRAQHLEIIRGSVSTKERFPLAPR